MRRAAVIEGENIVNIIVLSDGERGDALLSDDVIEITDLDPQPTLARDEFVWRYVIGSFVEPDDPTTWHDVRRERDRLLRATDWTQAVADAALTDEVRAEWAAYRQALRDLPETYATPQDVVWPIAPDGTGDPNYEVL